MAFLFARRAGTKNKLGLNDGLKASRGSVEGGGVWEDLVHYDACRMPLVADSRNFVVLGNFKQHLIQTKVGGGITPQSKLHIHEFIL